jgi:hypothetical protein
LRLGTRPTARRAPGLSVGIPAAPAAVGAVVLAAGLLTGFYAVRVTSWAVMTDELQIVRLATSIAESLSPVPRIHGEYYGALSQLYPLLIAPFFGFLTAPAASTAAHALNAVLLPSAAWPAYLLARSVGASRVAGIVAAALTAFTPWLVLTLTLLSENAAYPAFVWAVFLCHRALVAPTGNRDLAALAGLLLAFLARTQLLVIAAALPVALIAHEAGFARESGESWRRFAGRCVASHRVLFAAYGVTLLGVAGLALVGSVGVVVGNYAVPFEGDLLPGGIWQSTAAHFVQVVIGCGVVPFLLAAAWLFATVIRPARKEGHAFACLALVLMPLLTFEVASFDLRFTPGAFVQDRYLFYLAPLFAVGTAAALTQRTQLRLRAALLAGTALVFLWLVSLADYDDDTIIFWASPAAAFHPALATAGGWLHVSAGALIRVSTAAVAVAVAVFVWRLPRASVAVVTAVLAGWGLLQTIYVVERFGEPAMTRGDVFRGAPADWIDRAVPAGASVALVPSPHDTRDYWWEAELWNKDVDRVLRVGAGSTFTPFPAKDVSVDVAAGVLRGPQPSQYLVVSPSETRFQLLEASRVRDVHALRLVRVRRPYRLLWATSGISADGWTRPGRDAHLRFYGHDRGGRRLVVLTLSASRHAALPLGFVLRSGDAVRRGSVDPGGARPPVALAVCVPAAGFARATLTTTGAVRIPDGRLVALHVDRLQVSAAGRCRDRVSSP